MFIIELVEQHIYCVMKMKLTEAYKIVEGLSDQDRNIVADWLELSKQAMEIFKQSGMTVLYSQLKDFAADVERDSGVESSAPLAIP